MSGRRRKKGGSARERRQVGRHCVVIDVHGATQLHKKAKKENKGAGGPMGRDEDIRYVKSLSPVCGRSPALCGPDWVPEWNECNLAAGAGPRSLLRKGSRGLLENIRPNSRRCNS
eukprot:249433-Rhodomonas_salina.1